MPLQTIGVIEESNILNLVTHDLFECIDLIHKTFRDRLAFVEVIRDPIYMLKQAKH